MTRSNLSDCNDAYTHFKGTIAVLNIAAEDAAANNTNK